jgi:nucleoid-associated protein YgaU
MGYAIVSRAKEIIFSMEGHYGSVNANDNGAISVGACQWHGNRAKSLLKAIIKRDEETAVHLLAKPIVAEIKGSTSWAKRTVDDIERLAISMLLNTSIGWNEQDKLAEKDIQGYINHIMKFDITDEESIILLADIENQGGAGAVNRIVQNTFNKYGKYATIEQFIDVALTDKVFIKYQQRRLDVYKKLIGKPYTQQPVKCATHMVVKGDNLTLIAKRFGTTVKRLCEDNNISNPDVITLGQIIKIYK